MHVAACSEGASKLDASFYCPSLKITLTMLFSKKNLQKYVFRLGAFCA